MVTTISEISPALEWLLAISACFSAIIGLILRAFKPRSTFEVAIGSPDKSAPWLGAALGLLLLLLLLPLLR